MTRRFDSNGDEAFSGCLLRCSVGFLEFHVVYIDNGELTIRDLDCNNIGMYDLNEGYYNVGPFWEHCIIREIYG